VLNSKIIKICNQKFINLNYSENTKNIYIHYIEEFINGLTKQIVHLSSTDFQEYINNYKFTSISQQNQVISSIKFLYEKVLNKKYRKIDFTRPRNEKRLPQIIEKDFLLNKIDEIKNIKHKTIISLTYSTGLRVSEIINLKISDIDSKRMLIMIKQGKGKKDRIVPLSENILLLLRKYYNVYKPIEYLFNGQNSLKYSTTSCNKIVKKYLGNDKHFHLLRHSCFTTLLENGTDLRIIQKIAGHSNIKTTEIYTHVSTSMLNKVQLPI
jgi:site-specific recombinase XerD